ncbi:MAG: electron transfer flavoprotein subunit alpha/FixB family protein [Chitinophagales bacterium]|nr:electron transfer flavoprotein subunit alpha/FixB family protein [Chitinophagales bacterium]MDW8393606.1 electron transfer flavoprotein subunit alpha/FixB family protein [Chitinophagales bacterium]
MSVLVFVEPADGVLRKPAFEAMSYGSRLAAAQNMQAYAVCLDESVPEDSLKQLGAYGAVKVLHDRSACFRPFDAQVFARAVRAAAEAVQARIIVLSLTYNGRALGPLLSAHMQAGLVTGAIDFPETNGEVFRIRKNVFGGKAIATVEVATAVKIIALMPNAVAPVRGEGVAEVETFTSGLQESDRRMRLTGVNKVSGKVALSDAEIVVSAGRGMKGPENWGMIEELAEVLGAATACSRPVADVHWRPHEEHVGQTGLAIRPNLYIAVGISGAIQHLAGVNGSKVIVVINKDPEAPFFKAADYGIVGDAFEVVPALTRALRRFKAGEMTFN